MGNAIRIKHSQVPRQQGEQARLKVVHGPDYGAVYVFTGTHVTIGRGEENDAIISDLKASRRHAEFQLGASGWTVKDAGSANGIVHNGKATRQANLRTGDAITLGETTFEFVTSEAGTMMLVAPPKSMPLLQAEQAAFAEQRKRVKSLAEFGGLGASGGKGGLFANPKVLLIVGAGIAALLLLPAEDQKKAVRAPAGREDRTDLEKYLPQPQAAAAKQAESFFRAGFREFRTGNYLRARTHFETVLQMAPGHRLAILYLENCDKAIEEEVKEHMGKGKRAFSGGKLKEAHGHFDAVTRLLYRDQSNSFFTEAKEQIAKVEKQMKGEAD